MAATRNHPDDAVVIDVDLARSLTVVSKASMRQRRVLLTQPLVVHVLEFVSSSPISFEVLSEK